MSENCGLDAREAGKEEQLVLDSNSRSYELRSVGEDFPISKLNNISTNRDILVLFTKQHFGLTWWFAPWSCSFSEMWKTHTHSQSPMRP